MLEEQTVWCPYCGESFDTAIDISAGSQQYVEDCYVCCQPITIRVAVDYNGDLADVATMRDDEA